MRPAALWVTVLLFTSAQALPHSARVSNWVKEAERHYRAGEYGEAVALLQKAQAAEPDPRLIYNLARAYDQAGELRLALESYQQYLNSQEGTEGPLLNRAALAVDRLRALIAKEDALKIEADKAHPTPTQAETPEQRRARELSEARERTTRERALAAYDTARLQAAVVGGAGVVALVSGVGLGIAAAVARNQFQSATTASAKSSLQSSASLRAGLADACYALAIASGAVAVLLYPKHPPPVAVSVSPLVSERGAMVGAGVHF
jgi:tetratricopeptide (TPR) repeat protein